MTESQSTYAGAEQSPVADERAAPPLHVLLDVLANRRRRLVLQCLGDAAEPTTIDDLAEEVAARERGSEAVPEGDVERVALSLSHTHVPKLEDAGVVEYTRKYDELVLAVEPDVVGSFL